MKKKKIFLLIFVIIFLCFASIINAHSGRTDGQGGHKDKNNVSGLGGYHYHCGGHGPHLHENGGCPYAKKVDSQIKVEPQIAIPNNTQVIQEKKENKIVVSQIAIKQKDICLLVGEEKNLSYVIEPMNVDHVEVEWKSNNEGIVKIAKNGTITGIKEGETTVKVISGNGKEDSKVVKVQTKQSNEEKMVVPVSTKQVSEANVESTGNGDFLLGLGAIGMGILIYFVYKGTKK